MTKLENAPDEQEQIRKLLEEVRQTIRDNKLFIDKLKEDSFDQEIEIGSGPDKDSSLDEFEEL